MPLAAGATLPGQRLAMSALKSTGARSRKLIETRTRLLFNAPLSDNTIADFMVDESWPKAQKFRDNKNNGWTFEPLAESRAAWDQRYGPQPWNEMKEWDQPPKLSVLDQPVEDA